MHGNSELTVLESLEIALERENRSETDNRK